MNKIDLNDRVAIVTGAPPGFAGEFDSTPKVESKTELSMMGMAPADGTTDAPGDCTRADSPSKPIATGAGEEEEGRGSEGEAKAAQRERDGRRGQGPGRASEEEGTRRRERVGGGGVRAMDGTQEVKVERLER